MTTDVDMAKIRRRVAQCFVRDGVFEIIVGWELIMLSGFIATGRISILIIACITLVLTLPGFRKLLALRRAGYVALGNPFTAVAKEDAVAALGAIALFLLGPLAYTYWRHDLSAGLEIWKLQYLSPGMGLTLAVTFGSLARRWQVTRFYLVALVSAVAGIVALMVGPPEIMPEMMPFEMQLLSTAAVVGASGVIALVRFLRSDPVLEEDVSDGQE